MQGKKNEDKKFLYINIALFIGIIAMVLIFHKAFYVAPVKTFEKEPVTNEAETKEPVIYSIDKVAGQDQVNRSQPANLKEVYCNYPKEDAGNNMVDAWSKIRPEEKVKFNEEIDKTIEKAKETLVQEPENKAAKHYLFIAETLKKLAAENFNYKMEDAPKKINANVSNINKLKKLAGSENANKSKK